MQTTSILIMNSTSIGLSLGSLPIGCGGDYSIKLANSQWRNIRLRILSINKSLYIENLSCNTVVQLGVSNKFHPLLPFRPQPLCSGACVCKDDVELQFK